MANEEDRPPPMSHDSRVQAWLKNQERDPEAQADSRAITVTPGKGEGLKSSLLCTAACDLHHLPADWPPLGAFECFMASLRHHDICKSSFLVHGRRWQGSQNRCRAGCADIQGSSIQLCRRGEGHADQAEAAAWRGAKGVHPLQVRPIFHSSEDHLLSKSFVLMAGCVHLLKS